MLFNLETDFSTSHASEICFGVQFIESSFISSLTIEKTITHISVNTYTSNPIEKIDDKVAIFSKFL